MRLSHGMEGNTEDIKTGLPVILNAIVEGICAIDGVGNVTFCNDAFLEMTGFSAAEMIGNSVHHLIHHSHPDGSPFPADECPMFEFMRLGESIRTRTDTFWRKDGTPFQVRFSVRTLAWQADGTRCVVTVQDVTEAERSVEALRSSEESNRRNEEKFRRILSNLPDVAWTLEESGRVAYISPRIEELTGYSLEEIYSHGMTLLLSGAHPDDRDDLEKAIQNLFSHGKSFDMEFRLLRKDGVWIWVHSRAISPYEENGVQFADGVVSDISGRKTAEMELQSKTAFFEALVNSTSDAILVLDANGRRILQNQRMIDINRVPPEALLDPSDATMLRHTLSIVKKPGSFLSQIEYFNSHPTETGRDEVEFDDGTVFDRYSAPVIDTNGKCYGRIWTHRDITDRKRTEVELRAKTALLEAQANSTIDGLLVVDSDGHRVLQNQRLIEMFRIPFEFLECVDDRPMLEYVVQSVKDPAAFLTKVEYLYAHSKETSLDEVVLVDGTVLDRYSAPVADESGKYFGRIWSFRDVTERRRTEDKLRQLSTAVEQNSSSIVITDPSGTITYVNRKFSEITGYTFDEAVGQNPSILNSGYSPPEMYSALWTTIQAGKEWHGEFRNKKKNGEIIWESATITPVVDAKGYIVHFLAVKEDITARRQMESELRQAQKLEGIGQLAAGIAHEINTPTQFVMDNLTFMLESFETIFDLIELYRGTIRDNLKELPPEKAAEVAVAEEKADLEFICEEVPRAIAQGLDGARRVARIVRAMKEFSHPDSAEKTETDLNKGIASTITVARNEWKYVAEVSTNLDEALPPVMCYPGEVNQVILNLIVNSAHSIKDKIKEGEKGEITVSTRICGAFAEITIADTGMGIPDEIQNRIYEPFFTTKEVGKGTGQGLAFAHSVIVKKHQGKIWFETQRALGTTFFIQLPVNQPGAAREM